MFRDSQKELERIQQQLLEEDNVPETEDELLDDIADLVDDVQNSYEPDDFYNSDGTDLPPEELGDELLAPEKDSVKGLIVAACLLTLGIVLVLGWWIVRLLG